MIILKLNISKCDLNIISQFHLSELIAHHTTTVELARRVLLRTPFLKFSLMSPRYIYIFYFLFCSC